MNVDSASRSKRGSQPSRATTAPCLPARNNPPLSLPRPASNPSAQTQHLHQQQLVNTIRAQTSLESTAQSRPTQWPSSTRRPNPFNNRPSNRRRISQSPHTEIPNPPHFDHPRHHPSTKLTTSSPKQVPLAGTHQRDDTDSIKPPSPQPLLRQGQPNHARQQDDSRPTPQQQPRNTASPFKQ